jgi:transposase
LLDSRARETAPPEPRSESRPLLRSWLASPGIEAHVIHAASVAVSREHRQAKTDRLDSELLKRAFLGWLRGERDHPQDGRDPDN